MSTLRRRPGRTAAPALLAAVLAGTTSLVAGCGSGQRAPTRLEYAVTDGVQSHAGNVVLRNVLLTADVATGKAASSLALQGLVANNTGAGDRLTGVTAATVPFSAPTASAALAAGTTLNLGTRGLGLTVDDLPQPVLPGSLVDVTFSFLQSGNVTVAVPVYSLASRDPGGEPTARVSYPQPDLPEGFNESAYDNNPAS